MTLLVFQILTPLEAFLMEMLAYLLANHSPGHNLLELFKALPQVKQYLISSLAKNGSRVTSCDGKRVKIAHGIFDAGRTFVPT